MTLGYWGQDMNDGLEECLPAESPPSENFKKVKRSTEIGRENKPLYGWSLKLSLSLIWGLALYTQSTLAAASDDNWRWWRRRTPTVNYRNWLHLFCLFRHLLVFEQITTGIGSGGMGELGRVPAGKRPTPRDLFHILRQSWHCWFIWWEYFETIIYHNFVAEWLCPGGFTCWVE